MPHRTQLASMSLKSLPIKKRYIREQSISPTTGDKDGSNVDVKKYDSNPIPASSKTSESSSPSPDSSNGLKCAACGKTFSSSSGLRIHVRRHWNKSSGRYQCLVCGQTFSQRSGQVSHVRVHTQEKPYECESCPKRFADFSTFTKHRRVHSGDKPYHCPLCDRSFSQSGNLHRHVRVIHCNNRNNFFHNKMF